MRTFVDILRAGAQVGPRVVAVAGAEDRESLEAVKEAQDRGIARAILVGDAERIREMGRAVGLDLSGQDVRASADRWACVRTAVELVRAGEADMVMKGSVGSAELLKAVLDRENGMRGRRSLSHVAIFEVPGFDRLLFFTDGGVNILPDLSRKVEILLNGIELCHALGVAEPRVAVLAVVEVVNPDLPATVDAAALAKMAERGQIQGAVVEGPVALDNAICPRAAQAKGLRGPVMGSADMFLFPGIDSGNMVSKAVTYFAGGKMAGVVMGACAPVLLVSRADSHESRLVSIAAGGLVVDSLQAASDGGGGKA